MTHMFADGMPLVSVIMPARNAERTVRDSVASVLNQGCKDLELLVVDDGSTDGTRKVLNTITDSRLRILEGGGAGVSHARNVGISESRGTFVAFADSDDLLEPEAVEGAVKLIEKHRCDMVIGGMCKVWPDGREVAFSIDSGSPVEFKGEEISALIEATVGYSSPLDPRLSTSHLTGSWCRLVRRHQLDGLQFDESLSIGEDTVFNVAVLKRCSCVVVTPEIWYSYRQNSGSAVYRYRRDAFEMGAAMLRALKRELEIGYVDAFRRRALFQLEGAVRQRIAPGCPEKSLIEKANALRQGLGNAFWADYLADCSEIRGLGLKHKVFLFFARHRATLALSTVMEIAK